MRHRRRPTRDRRCRSSRRSEARTSAFAAAALALYALAAPLARVAAQRPVQLDAIAIRATVSARARLAENAHGSGIPRDRRGRIGGGARRRQRIGDARVQRQRDAPQVLTRAGSEERRVGEEGRSRWAPYHLKKKEQRDRSA